MRIVLFPLLWLGLCAPCRAGWDVAYSARFYYPPGGSRISHQQIYLSDIQGKHRKQITFGNAECGSVQWLDSNRLAWLKMVSDNKMIGQVLDLRTWKIKSLPAGSLPDAPNQNLAPQSAVTADDKEIWRIPGQPPVAYKESSSSSTTLLPDEAEIDIMKTSLSREGKTYTFEFPGRLTYMLPGKDKNHTWAISGFYSASGGSFEFLTDIDWSTGKAKRMASELFGFDMYPQGRYFVAREGGRRLSPYGTKREVWTCKIYAGDLVTGRKWTIASGLVLGDSAVLRPSK